MSRLLHQVVAEPLLSRAPRCGCLRSQDQRLGSVCRLGSCDFVLALWVDWMFGGARAIEHSAPACLAGALPASVVHDFVERPPVEPLEWSERPVRGVAEREEVCEEVVLGEAENLAGELLILHG